MKEIQLTQGKVALVDDEDFEYLNQFKWHAGKNANAFYASRGAIVDGRKTTILMHCVIMNGKGIDHIDHNGLNNQKCNLRFCTVSENGMNRRKERGMCSSIYKGVNFHKATSQWRAQIRFKGNRTYLGYFDTEIEAAKAYNKKAIEIFGEFANLNKFDIEK